MAKTAFDYPVTQPYGYDKAYGGVHSGVDYGAPEGVPIVVNGVLIGLVGWTGKVYDSKGEKTPAASHLHVSHVVGGKTSPINPQDGRNVSGAYASQIGEDSVNGKFVRLQDKDGSNWVYCHMSNNNILRQGAVIADQPQYNGEVPKEQDMYPNKGDVINAYKAAGRKEPPTEEEIRVYTSKPWSATDGLYYGKTLVDLKNAQEATPAGFKPLGQEAYIKAQ